jgi:hypothetical protein
MRAGPSERVDGYWYDTGMTLEEFQEHDPNVREIREIDFEAAWDRFLDSSSLG